LQYPAGLSESFGSFRSVRCGAGFLGWAFRFLRPYYSPLGPICVQYVSGGVGLVDPVVLFAPGYLLALPTDGVYKLLEDFVY
jgi:hypothetical protein